MRRALLSLGHSHSHSHHEHHHDHDHDHDHDHGHGAQAAPPWRRLLVAALLVLFAVAAACLVQVRSGADNVQRFMRAVRNQPDEAARQLRTFVGSALETTASAYDLADLVNTEASRVRIGDFEARLREQIDNQLLATYGVKVVQVGIERLTLPKVTLGATVDRMRAERETIATERTAEGRRQAAEIRSAAERDARVIQAEASVKAAEIEAQARVEAARIYGKAYAGSPQLYNLLRSLDTLGTIVNGDTRLVLRTDAAPFRVLVDGPPALPAEAPANGRRP